LIAERPILALIAVSIFLGSWTRISRDARRNPNDDLPVFISWESFVPMEAPTRGFELRCVPNVKRIADSGLIIAALDRRDLHHAWARKLFEKQSPPWLVCEAVLAETAASVGTPLPVLEMLRLGDLEIAFDLADNLVEVLGLAKKYHDQKMDLADACVVRMSEIFDDALVYTVDKADFLIYRRHSRQPVPCVFPH
jgi:predicted nucleic acid-binding protein